MSRHGTRDGGKADPPAVVDRDESAMNSWASCWARAVRRRSRAARALAALPPSGIVVGVIALSLIAAIVLFATVAFGIWHHHSDSTTCPPGVPTDVSRTNQL